MKKLIIIILLLAGIKGYSQTDTVIWYKDTVIQYKVDTAVIWGNDTSIAPNYFRANYHYISGNDSIYQPQFIMRDSLNNKLLPTTSLNGGWRSSYTVREYKLNATQILWTPEQLRDSLILLDLKLIYGNNNVTKL